MAFYRGRHDWNQTAHLLAVLINANHNPKRSRPVTPEQLNPYAELRRREPDMRLNSRDSLALLKRVFIDQRPPEK